ncbi:hypothetical protein FHU13_005124 [Methylobacterium sp. R2-1]|nr:hypothetical protein [Methylobacterium sp. R2-1]
MTLIDAGIFREWMVGLGRCSAFEQVAHLFCELYLKLQSAGVAGSCRCEFPLTQIDLAEALSLTDVHVNRVLKEMCGRSLVTLRGNMPVIEAWDELLQAAELTRRTCSLGSEQPQQRAVRCPFAYSPFELRQGVPTWRATSSSPTGSW